MYASLHVRLSTPQNNSCALVIVFFYSVSSTLNALNSSRLCNLLDLMQHHRLLSWSEKALVIWRSLISLKHPSASSSPPSSKTRLIQQQSVFCWKLDMHCREYGHWEPPISICRIRCLNTVHRPRGKLMVIETLLPAVELHSSCFPHPFFP